MKDKRLSLGRRIVAFLKSLGTKVNYLVSLLLLVGMIVAVYWLGKSVYENFFLTQEQNFSLNLSKYSEIDLAGKKDCQLRESVVSVHIDRPLGKYDYQKISFESNQGADFELTFPSGVLSAQGYRPDKSSENIVFNNAETTLVSGKATQIKVDYLQVSSLAMSQDFCASQLIIYPNPMVRFGLLSVNTPKAIWLRQALETQDRIKVTILNPEIQGGFSGEKFEQIDFEFVAGSGRPILDIAVSANDLGFVLPEMHGAFGEYPSEYIKASSEIFTIGQPVGILKFGNNEPINLMEITSRSNNTLTIGRNGHEIYLSDNYLETERYDKLEISGIANNIILNKEEKILPAWRNLPEYVQAGLFGFLLSIVGGLWTLRQIIGKWMLSLLPFLKPKFNLTKGSFVLVMNSGFVVAGELSRKPAKNYPYYLLKNARRKPSISGDWEEEIISEIKIRADVVDQSYVV